MLHCILMVTLRGLGETSVTVNCFSISSVISAKTGINFWIGNQVVDFGTGFVCPLPATNHYYKQQLKCRNVTVEIL